MQIILSILLYLNVISSPGTYMSSEISHDVTLNQSRVDAVYSDPALVKTITNAYATKVASITVLDDGQLK